MLPCTLCLPFLHAPFCPSLPVLFFILLDTLVMERHGASDSWFLSIDARFVGPERLV
jgi:hypothetical protein